MTILSTAKITESDIKNASTEDLVDTYNAIFTDAPVKKFRDRKTAEARTWKAIGQLPTAVDISKPEKKASKTVEKTVEKTVVKKIAENKKAKRTMRFCFAPHNKTELTEPRKTSLRGQLFAFFSERGEKGVLFSEVQAKFPHWKKTDAYEGIRLIHFTTGYGMWSNEENDDIRIQLVAEKQVYNSLLAEAKKQAA